ncbi:MAG TPA: preprotein translocase subunit SecE [Baekduia sp.]|uniref:preprotein translocase subunit SecE n=1 Tax=Baekduia sp. TaxID=2600305 RepID=UPI002C935C96|nr:preprotein translocase subunit SecE [Baekduia sp.]HMJ37342.1 preprotein translocase subunit SecE [Baekduia sp.]
MAPDRKNPGPEPTEPHRENVPGELDHASGEVEEFEAGLVSGADGTPDGTTTDAELERAATEAVGDLDDDGDVDEEDRAIARRGGREPAKSGGGGPRFFVFLKASWAELQRVQWPDRRQVAQATAVVVGFVIVAGAYLGLADWVAQKVVDVIL